MIEKLFELCRGDYHYYIPIPDDYHCPIQFDRGETIKFINKEILPVKSGDVINLITPYIKKSTFDPDRDGFTQIMLFIVVKEDIKKEDEDTKMKNYIMLCRKGESFIFDNLGINITTKDIIFGIDKKFPIKYGDVIKYCYFTDGNTGGPLKFCSYIVATIGNTDMENIREHNRRSKSNDKKIDNNLSVLDGATKMVVRKCTRCVDGKPEIYDDIQYVNKKENDHSKKRDDYISWDEYFMGIAALAAHRSKDPGTQVGACIVDSDMKIVSIGYNGFPNHCSDDEFPWSREADDAYDTKYVYVVHAELNAILNSGGRSLKDTSIFVTLFPCNECAKAIIQSGIKRIVYQCDKYEGSTATKASKRMLKAAGVELIYLPPVGKDITITL